MNSKINTTTTVVHNFNIPGIKKVIVSSLLVIFINDFIKGASVDILSPIWNKILPGDVREPAEIFGVKLYLTRFLVRILNLALACLAVAALYSMWGLRKA